MPQLDFSLWLTLLIFTWFSINVLFIWVYNNKISNTNFIQNSNNLNNNFSNWTWN